MATMQIVETVWQSRGLRFPALEAGEGEPVLLLHGFPDCFANWRETMAALAPHGYRMLAPALRGYAASCLASDGDYSLHAATLDVCDLAAQLGGSVHLVGHDWGAVVAYLAAAHAPQGLFRSLSTLAIPPLKRLRRGFVRVPRQLWLSSYIALFQMPRLPERWLQRKESAGVAWLWQRWSPGLRDSAACRRAQDTLRDPAILNAALAWYRHLPSVASANRKALRWLRKPIPIPTHIMMGADDHCMDARLLHHTVFPQDFPAGVSFEIIQDAGHFLHLEQPTRIHNALLTHWRQP